MGSLRAVISHLCIAWLGPDVLSGLHEHGKSVSWSINVRTLLQELGGLVLFVGEHVQPACVRVHAQRMPDHHPHRPLEVLASLTTTLPLHASRFARALAALEPTSLGPPFFAPPTCVLCWMLSEGRRRRVQGRSSCCRGRREGRTAASPPSPRALPAPRSPLPSPRAFPAPSSLLASLLVAPEAPAEPPRLALVFVRAPRIVMIRHPHGVLAAQWLQVC